MFGLILLTLVFGAILFVQIAAEIAFKEEVNGE